MSTISIQRRHHLGREQARALACELAKSLEERFSTTSQWRGDELHIERSGASGRVLVSDDRVEVEVKLGLLLRPMRDSIAGKINERLDRLLGSVA